MKTAKMSFGLMAGVLAAATFGTGAAHAAPLAPAPAATAKISLPVVAGVQSLSKTEKAATTGEGLVTLNVLNNSNLLNNLNVLNNILNFGSFNSFKSGGSSNCGCGSPS